MFCRDGKKRKRFLLSAKFQIPYIPKTVVLANTLVSFDNEINSKNADNFEINNVTNKILNFEIKKKGRIYYVSLTYEIKEVLSHLSK